MNRDLLRQGVNVAALVAILLSSESGFVAGQSFMDGGMTRKMSYR
jgi:hypothetical protein